MDETKENTKEQETKIKTRPGSGFLKQLYSSARTTAENTHSNFRNLTTFLVNFVQVEKIDASELQVRTHFDDEEIKTLANSIKEHGVLQPILVVQNGDRYKVIAGERRLRATKLAGLERIPARVLSTDDKATHEIALRENLDRVDLHPIEEGEGYLSLLENQTYTSYESIAKAFGKPKSRITECIGFTRLPDDTKLELMQRNIKNRSLLRQLLQMPPTDHKKIIEEASQKEEVLLINENNVSVDASNEKEKLTTTEKKEPKPFAYHFDGKKLVVPSFIWKVGEGPERLKEYLQALAKIQEQTRSLS
ncbi:MAG: ParB/RepB/Spo0J family partition protein [Bdellovibrio sp.]|nr:ParB/RepB/Spo0J family partition protein [Bdellovibrio sp.]